MRHQPIKIDVLAGFIPKDVDEKKTLN